MITPAPRVLLIDGAPELSEALHARLRQRGFAATRQPLASDAGAAAETDVAVVLLDPASAASGNGKLDTLLHGLIAEKVPTLIHSVRPAQAAEAGPLVEWLPPDVPLDELVGRLTTLARYAPLVRAMDRELEHLHRLGEQLNRYFGEIDQEMRLAGRLQRDFLPRAMPEFPPLHFEVLYRPASWVSGDMYDVFRIDDHRVGVFLADAMGHGVAAGLLTMFLRQALVVRRVVDQASRNTSPVEVLHGLNDCLAGQALPNSQFVTAVYAIIDARTREVTLARAGHPYPILIRPGGEIRELRSSGSLLGLPDVPAEFQELRITLDPGDRLLLYTDGIETVIAASPGTDQDPVLTPHFRDWAQLDGAAFLQAFSEHLDRQEGSLHPADDVTAILLEVAGAGRT